MRARPLTLFMPVPIPHSEFCGMGARMVDRRKAEDLDARIAAARAAHAPAPAEESKYHKANMAWQMVIELVAGMVLGLGIGWSLDWLFGTVPLFLAIFGILGFVAGVRTMMRTAQRVQERAAAKAAEDKAPSGDA